MPRVKDASRYFLGVCFIVAGLNHFANTEFYVSIMPPYLPAHRLLVYLSGIAETALGALLLWRHWSAVAAWGLIGLLIAVFPANLHMALNPERYPQFSPLALWLRLPVQAVLIAWAYWYTRDERSAPGPRQSGD